MSNNEDHGGVIIPKRDQKSPRYQKLRGDEIIPGQKFQRNEPRMHPPGKGEPKPNRQIPERMKGRRG